MLESLLCARVHCLLTNIPRGRFKRLGEEQDSLRAKVKASSKFSMEQKAAIDHISTQQFDEYWKAVNEEAENFDSHHQKGRGLRSRRYQELMSSASEFMRGFNPIIETVEHLSSPYGGLAIGAISFLFAVSIASPHYQLMSLWLKSPQVSENKSKTESLISTTLTQIKERLPRISLQSCLHDDGDEVDTQLQQKVVEAYEAFMEFSIEAIRYYQLSGHRESSCSSSDLITLNSSV